MRAYETSHPWLSFSFDPRRLSQHVWLLLGQIEAKCDQISGIPLSPIFAESMHHVYLARGVHATTAIEGNSMSEEEVLEIVRGESDVPPSREYLERENQNVIDAWNNLADRIFTDGPTELCVEDILEFNRQMLDGLPAKEGVIPGVIRQHRVWVTIAGYEGAPAEDLPFLLDKLCTWLSTGFPTDARHRFAVEILKAIIAHVYIAWIHPFADGNGRTARFAELSILLGAGLPKPAAHLLSNHYNQTRSEYYRQLDLSSKHDDGLYSFIGYALQGLVDGLDEQLQYIEQQQLSVHWESFVYAQFEGKDNANDRRRRNLVLDLSEAGRTVPLEELRYLSGRTGEAYAGLSLKTIRRDVSELEKLFLVQRTQEGVRAVPEIMRAFMPERARPMTARAASSIKN